MQKFLFALVALFLNACSMQGPNNTSVYLLLDTSGTYSQQVEQAQVIVHYLLASLNSSDSLAVARIDSASFSEKDIIARVTFDTRPSAANAQKRAFKKQFAGFADNVKASSHTDITGGLLQAIEYLNETGAANRYILVFSDLKEEVRKGHIRDFDINFKKIKVIAMNVTKLKSDNVDPRKYLGRLESWRERVEEGGGSWRVMNDLERMDRLLEV